MKTPSEERIIIALDVPDRTKCEHILQSLKPALRIVKVGPILFGREGPKILSVLRNQGLSLFLDLKFHDIPNTVSGAVEAVLEHAPLSFFTVHASGGPAMIESVRKTLERSYSKERPKILAVTVLTSLTSEVLTTLGYSSHSLEDHVLRLAQLSINAGADGIVASALEVAHLRTLLPSNTILVVPGVRFSDHTPDDQKRVATPAATVKAGASYLVVGRPVTRAQDPRTAFDRMIEETKGQWSIEP